MNLLIITGLSGAGKSQTIRTLEDIGYYCIDNLPPQLILFTVNFLQPTVSARNVALVIDARSKELFTAFQDELKKLTEAGIVFRTLFLDCADDKIFDRYKETRRKHLLMNANVTSLEEAIQQERDLFQSIRICYDFVIDTTYLKTSQLRKVVTDYFKTDDFSGMQIKIISFGFSFGIPVDADVVLDVRCLPNPFYISKLRDKTGTDPEVYEYVFQFPESAALVSKFVDLLDYTIPLYVAEGKNQLVIAIGCTGGKHRSIAIAEYLNNYITHPNTNVTLLHRDEDKKLN